MKKEKNMALYCNKNLRSDFFFPKIQKNFCFVLFCLILPYNHFKTFHLLWCGVPHFTDPTEAREGRGGVCTHGLSLLWLCP